MTTAQGAPNKQHAVLKSGIKVKPGKKQTSVPKKAPNEKPPTTGKPSTNKPSDPGKTPSKPAVKPVKKKK